MERGNPEILSGWNRELGIRPGPLGVATREKWYSLVDSLRTSLAQSGQNLEIDMEEVGALVELAE